MNIEVWTLLLRRLGLFYYLLRYIF